MLLARAARLSQHSGWNQAFESWTHEKKSHSVPAPDALSKTELQRVVEGWTVSRAFDFELEGRKYVGGAAYQVIGADAAQILDALSDASQLPDALPLTHHALTVDSFDPGHPRASNQLTRERSGIDTEGFPARALSVELHQGNAWLHARYTIHLRRTDPNTLRFALDPSRRHDIKDARGIFTAHRLSPSHSLVSVFVGVDLGRGLAVALLKRPVQKAALTAPAHLRKYLEPLAERERIARAAKEETQRQRQRNQVATWR